MGRHARSEPPIRLRGHHFLCLLTYKGLGYTPPFVENMTALVDSINAGQAVVLTIGPDDICDALSAPDRVACNHDCAKAETMELDDLAIAEVTPVIGKDLRQPFVMTGDMVFRLRKAFSNGAIRSACTRCRWKTICDKVAKDDYSETRLFSE